ncbi:uncharacterized protein LOC116190054 [Punica granatum]|uniref:Uncharacterized protein n=2 Tax=Punica granatum TaxID=22663 RepID=A0A218WH47_PUNGR|nr:uncharacterized protein LOC116190054 [Punica granatum]OWM72174.1 hypothetical protein CDL15_Pgr018057 [Punica granatum]PKI35434.1 hypothetical protein CRG98_044177 [Punica granatum]
MEKPAQLKKLTIQIDRPKSAVWDCGSTLYDSFELKSFKNQLDSAISSRTLSMPHLPDHCVPTAVFDPAVPTQPISSYKKPSKISRSLNKLVRSIFRTKRGSSGSMFRVKGDRQGRDGFYILYDKSGALTTIPEAPEIDHLASLSPEINSLVRRTASDRFAAPSVGISCAQK